MADYAKTPAIRFAGFTDAWEQRKVSDMFKVTRGYVLAATLTADSQSETMPFPVYSSQTKDNGLMGFYKDYLYEDAITWTTDGANAGTVNYRAGKFYCTNVCGVLLSDKIAANQMVAEALNNVAKGYVSYVGNPKLMNNVMADIEIMIPPKQEEREQISKFFEYLDDLITLHQHEPLFLVMLFSGGSCVFKSAWEQRKLSDLAEKTYGGGTPATSNEAFWNGSIPWIQSSDIADGKLFGVVPRKYITNEALNKSATQLVPANSLAIITRVGVGKLAFMPFSYTTSQDFLSLSKLNTEPFFTVYACYKKLQSELNAVQGTSIKGITKDELLAKAIMVPKYREQEQIGCFFRSLDNLITLHQRKYDKLMNIKKSMLEKMFPRDGANVPEIRFAGFTDAWEQRKLSDIADKVIEKNAGLRYVETFTNSAEYGVVSQRDFFDHDISKMESLDGYYVVREEDFVYNPRISVTAPVGPINRNKLGRIGVMSPLYTVFRTHDIDTTYLEHYFKSVYWHSFMRLNGDSGARSDRFSIKDSLFFEMPIPYPDIVEQRKIGEWLTSLDDLITLHQRELEKLRNIKQSCLEKMFV